MSKDKELEKVKAILEDLIISCQNHRRGLGDCKGVEFNRFGMRIDALTTTLKYLEKFKNQQEKSGKIIVDLESFMKTQEEDKVKIAELRAELAQLREEKSGKGGHNVNEFYQE